LYTKTESQESTDKYHCEDVWNRSLATLQRTEYDYEYIVDKG